jgi:hypothetical protein
MALETKERIIYARQRAIRGWELHYPRSIRHEVFWEEWLSTHAPRFRPIQMRFIYPDFPVITEESLKDYESLLRGLLTIASRDIGKVCREYIDRISANKAVREILVVEGEKVTTIWTIIKAPPFEDSVREPIYAAQLQILGSLEQVIPVDFYVLNKSELPSDEKLSDIIPSNARSVWRR